MATCGSACLTRVPDQRVSINGFYCRQVLDSNGSGGLTSQEFCAAMKKLVPRCVTPLAPHAQLETKEKTCCFSSSQTHPAQHMDELVPSCAQIHAKELPAPCGTVPSLFRAWRRWCCAPAAGAARVSTRQPSSAPLGLSTRQAADAQPAPLRNASVDPCSGRKLSSAFE